MPPIDGMVVAPKLDLNNNYATGGNGEVGGGAKMKYNWVRFFFLASLIDFG